MDAKMNLDIEFLSELLTELGIVSNEQAGDKQLSSKVKKLATTLGNISTHSADDDSLRHALDEVPCNISWIDSDLRYLGVNQPLARTFAVKPEDVIGQKFGFHIQENVLAKFAEDLFKSLEIRASREVSISLDNQTTWFRMIGRKYQRNTKAMIIGLDITASKMAEEAMIQQGKLAFLGTMAGSILHDIANPLMIVKSTAARLKDMENIKLDEDMIRKHAMSIYGAAERISGIVKTFRNFSRDTQHDSMQPFYVHDLIADAVSLWKPMWDDDAINLDLNYSTDLLVQCSEIEISQVLVNLLTNASHAVINKEESWVRVTAEALEQRVDIRVTDSGKGIPLPIVDKIFNPFFTTKKKDKGTGLGLAICKKIAQRHGGDIYVDDNEPNTCFVFTLPLFEGVALSL
jgi:signal transduction histidine kinase